METNHNDRPGWCRKRAPGALEIARVVDSVIPCLLRQSGVYGLFPPRFIGIKQLLQIDATPNWMQGVPDSSR